MNEYRLKKVCKEEAYNTQLHGISSEQFVDKLRQPFEQAFKTSFEDFQEQLIESGESKKVVRGAARVLLPQLFQEDLKKLDKKNLADSKKHPKNYAKIDNAFSNLAIMTHVRYFHIPDDILLPEDSCHSEAVDPSKTLANNRRLYNEFLEEKQLTAHLDGRLAELNAIKEKLEQTKRDLQTLESLVS